MYVIELVGMYYKGAFINYINTKIRNTEVMEK